ncbi:hypothetical protein KCU88_g735, partial [Aureobasidium melanogenum]
MMRPCPFVTRTKNASTSVCVDEFAEDAVATLQQTLMCIITGDETYLNNSIDLLNAWGSTLTKVNEIVRAKTDRWAEDDIVTFSHAVSTAMYPPAAQYILSVEQSIPFIANWGTSGAKFMLAAAVFLENQTAYDTAKYLMVHSQCANFTSSISETGQTSETGISPVDWPVISEVDIWPVRPTWEMGYGIAKHILGIELHKTREMIFAVAPDAPNPPNAIADGSAFQTLRYRRFEDAEALNGTGTTNSTS